MRTISAPAQAILDDPLSGMDPIIVIEVDWAGSGKVRAFAEKEVTSATFGTIPAKIATKGALDNVITIAGATANYDGDSQSTSVVYDDADGKWKTDVLQSTDIHKAVATVYLYINGTTYDTDKILLYTGEINTPIRYQHDRTAHFTIVNKIESIKVGFSVEEAVDFAREDLIGKPFPLAFGTNLGVPALRESEVAKGILKDGFPIHDFTAACRADQLSRIACPLKDNGIKCHGRGGSVQGISCNTDWIQDPVCTCRISAEIKAIEDSLVLQFAAEAATQTIEIGGGAHFEQGVITTMILCDNAEVTGIFNGDTFTVHSRRHPLRDTLTCPPIKNFFNPGLDYLERERNPFTPPRSDIQKTTAVIPGTQCLEDAAQFDRLDFGWDYLATFPKANFYWCNAGTDVTLKKETVYAVNLIPSTVHSVWAWRTFETGGRQYVEVPEDLYTTRVSDFNVYMVQEVVFAEPLSRRGEGWEDDIFVNFTSTVGPNVIDIMEWLITLYLPNLTWDVANFDALNTKLEVYPAEFSLHEDRPSVLDVLRWLASEARCALVLRNNEFRLVYLPDVPPADFTLDESNVLPGSFEITHSDTDELFTKINGTYSADYSKNDRKFSAHYNIGPYQTHEFEMPFHTLTQFKLISKTLTFWLMRMSNTWQKIIVKTPLNQLGVEVLDSCDVTLKDFVPGTIRCVVERATVDVEAKTIEMELWTPIRSGEKTTFDFAYPGDISVTKLWPSQKDIQDSIVDGEQPNVDVTIPTGHPINPPKGFSSLGLDTSRPEKCTDAIAVNACSGRKEAHGDTVPTDKDDTKPTKDIPGSGAGTVTEKSDPLGKSSETSVASQKCCDEAKSDAAKANDEANRAKEGQEDSGGEDEQSCEEINEQLPDEPTNRCTAVVQIGWSRPVNGVAKCGAGASFEPGDTGRNLGTGNEEDNAELLYFNSFELAETIATRWNTIAKSYSATNGGDWPVEGATGNFTGTKGTWHSAVPPCQEPELQEQVGQSLAGDGEGQCGTSDISNPEAPSMQDLGSVKGCSGGQETDINL